MFGKKITTENARRVIRKIEWVSNNQYDMYRHDYGQNNQAPVSKALKLYDADYYVITSDFKFIFVLKMEHLVQSNRS